MKQKKLPAVHSGKILLEEFLEPMGIRQYRLAKGIKASPLRINEIVQGKRSISADTALRLARFFGTGTHVWLNLQSHYDLETEKDRLGDKIEKELEILAAQDRLLIYHYVPRNDDISLAIA